MSLPSILQWVVLVVLLHCGVADSWAEVPRYHSSSLSRGSGFEVCGIPPSHHHRLPPEPILPSSPQRLLHLARTGACSRSLEVPLALLRFSLRCKPGKQIGARAAARGKARAPRGWERRPAIRGDHRRPPQRKQGMVGRVCFVLGGAPGL